MALDPVTAVLDIGGKLIDHFFPDATKAAEAKLKLIELQQTGELQQIAGQLDINKQEASSTNWWVAGWRPFCGWIGGLALAYAAILEPVGRFLAEVVFGYKSAFPQLDTTITMQILFGILGLGAYRTAEKVRGAEGNR